MNRNAFRVKISTIFTDEEVNFIMMAYDLSKYGHRNQERESTGENDPISEKRYFNHPKRMAIQMLDDGIRDVDTICIALLHDCPEDTALFGNQYTDGYYAAMNDVKFRLTRIFNSAIAESVITLTIPQKSIMVPEFASKTKCLKFYKNKLSKASTRALSGKLYDRLDNLDTIEVKSLKIANLKLKETREFYIPLFQERFCAKDSDLARIGYNKTLDLMTLVEDKSYLIRESALAI